MRGVLATNVVYAEGRVIGIFGGSAEPCLITPIAICSIDVMSETLAGTTIELPALARLPNSLMYCSARRSCMASKPPGILMTSATRRMPSAVAVAMASDGLGLTFGFVDLLLALRFRVLDHLLLVAVGVVDRGVALALGLQDHGALLTLGAHLLFHRRQDVLRRGDVLDLVAQHLHAPRFRGLVHFGRRPSG